VVSPTIAWSPASSVAVASMSLRKRVCAEIILADGFGHESCFPRGPASGWCSRWEGDSGPHC
jgi:hypothetical protein